MMRRSELQSWQRMLKSAVAWRILDDRLSGGSDPHQACNHDAFQNRFFSVRLNPSGVQHLNGEADRFGISFPGRIRTTDAQQHSQSHGTW
jgi:hypothetical protein